MTKWVYSFSAERAEGRGEMKNLLWAFCEPLAKRLMQDRLRRIAANIAVSGRRLYE